MKLTANVKGLKNLERTLSAESRRQKKALDTAVKVEGYRLMRQLKKEIRAGAPGGRKFAGLTYLSRMWGGGKRLRPDKPLRRLAIAVRYHIRQTTPLDMRIGWVGPRVSKSWKRIAARQQEGFTAPVTESRRGYFAGKGQALSKRSKARKYMFIRKSTQRFKTPARPIMDPFWSAEKDKAWRNIQKNFRTALRGRIIRSGYGKTVRGLKRR